MASREPFSRHRGRGDERSDPDALARAADFAAAEYGWEPGYLTNGVTDEQLVLLFDAAQDRIEQLATAEFERLVEAVRIGTVFAHDAKQYTSWRSRRAGTVRASPGLAGAALERTIGALALSHPDLVARI